MAEPLHIDFHLLDRQLVDRDGLLVGNVDDVELDDDLRVVALLVGQLALGDRIGGRIGGLMSAVARRLAPQAHPRPMRIPFALVDEVGSAVRLTAALADLGDQPLEAWLREHVVDRIPGADHAGE
jgi:sporulation protein YlmC with PRC-barrel domain